MVERKYQLVKLGNGDWILPGNDDVTVWRFTKSYEDGSLVGSDGPIKGWFWNLSRDRDPGAVLGNSAVFVPASPSDWDRWEIVETLLPTRQAAIDAAMRLEHERKRETSGHLMCRECTWPPVQGTDYCMTHTPREN